MSQHRTVRLRTKKRIGAGVGLGFLILVLFWLSLVSGSEGIRPGETAALFGAWHGTQGVILSEIRLPRVLGAFLAGAALGLSGTLMQGALRNPLASPFTLGISQAAGFGASFAIIVLQAYGSDSPLAGSLGVTACAFAASLLCTGAILWLGRSVGMRPASLILAGVALGALFGAMTMFLQYFATDLDTAATLFWTFGDLGKAAWTNIAGLSTVLLAVWLFFQRAGWRMDALLLGDERAGSLGVPVGRLRTLAMLFSSLPASVAVAYFGIIGFVGLAAPHLVRLGLGESNAALIPLSALAGGALLMAADLAARLILLPVVLPVGILTAFLGAPLFLYLLVRGGRAWH